MPEKAFYEAMSRDQLIARLKVAEDALTLIGWSSTKLGELAGSERADAAEQMWHMWCSMVGLEFSDPENHPDLDARVPVLAAQREAIRQATLAKIEKLFPPVSGITSTTSREGDEG